MKRKPHLLIIRFSSLGDVSLSIPVIKNLMAQNPGLKISVLSKAFHCDLFREIPSLEFIAFDSEVYSGVFGLCKFVVKELFSRDFTHIVDLHDVLRSKIIRLMFTFKNAKKVVFVKGREEKEQAIRAHSLPDVVLAHTSERYAEAFERAGFQCDLTDRSKRLSIEKKEHYRIGIAPLSKHFTKNLPLTQVELLIQKLLEDQRIEVKLLCSRAEQNSLSVLSEINRVSFLNENNLSFGQELDAMKKLDLIVSMDSANMHIAAIYEIPVVSVWGGTHPAIGFSSYYKSTIDIQNEENCRPCSVYGVSACPLGHFNCMKNIVVEKIANSVFEQIPT